ncbi:hypothetical protein VP1G_02299 [Cytospora mali]|uniref:Uncharacterized protein n=1 Tax=Cytospora mali TaxID=578113 RepID=A0A194UT79_CYTMA|nr:hypothetical protein VP1G_02299 [Valsa mali var. pyri (nom. inval.)]
MPTMATFKIVVHLVAFALLFAGKVSAVTSAASSVTNGKSSEVTGTAQPQTKAFAPLEFSVADLLSTLSGESIARTHMIDMAMTTTVTPSGDTPVSVSAFTTANTSTTSDATLSQTEGVSSLHVSAAGLMSTLSEESTASTYHNTDAVSISIIPPTQSSAPVAPWTTVGLTITFPGIPNYGSKEPSAGAVTSSDSSFDVTFTDIPPTGTGQPHSSTITTQPIPTTPNAPSSSTKNGGLKGAKPVKAGLVAVAAGTVVAVLFF